MVPNSDTTQSCDRYHSENWWIKFLLIFLIQEQQILKQFRFLQYLLVCVTRQRYLYSTKQNDWNLNLFLHHIDRCNEASRAIPVYMGCQHGFICLAQNHEVSVKCIKEIQHWFCFGFNKRCICFSKEQMTLACLLSSQWMWSNTKINPILYVI